MRIPHVDPQGFIECRSPEHVYILGLLWADGYILNKPRKHDYRVSIKFHTKDMDDIVPVFLRTGPWASYPTRNGQTTQWQLTTNNKIWVRFLVDHDYIAKSMASADKILNHVPESLRHYWWRGYFDGDGSINDPKDHMTNLDFASGLEQDWTFMGLLEEATGTTLKKRLCVTKNGNSSHVYVCNRHEVLKIAEYMYRGRPHDGIGLSRKISRFQGHLLRNTANPDRHIGYHTGTYHVEISVGGKRYRRHGIGSITEARQIRQELYDNLDAESKQRFTGSYANILV